MDRFTRTADIIKAYYSYKQTADSATFVKKVCSFFDFIKDESLSDADLNLLLFLANEAGIPQYYDLLKSKFTNAEIGDESINSLTMSALFHDASLIRGDSKLHRYQKHVLDSFVATQRNRYVLTAPTSFGKTFLVYEIMRKPNPVRIIPLEVTASTAVIISAATPSPPVLSPSSPAPIETITAPRRTPVPVRLLVTLARSLLAWQP